FAARIGRQESSDWLCCANCAACPTIVRCRGVPANTWSARGIASACINSRTNSAIVSRDTRSSVGRAPCKTAAVLRLAVPASHAVAPVTPFVLKRWQRRDTWALAALVLTSVLYASAVHLSLDDRLFAIPLGNDVWFEADMPVVSDTMLHRWSDHSRNAHHPLFALMTTTPTYALRPILSARARVAVVVTFAALIWGAAVYLLMRALTDSLIDAMTFSVLTFVSAGSLFWLPAAETYALGSASLLVPVALLAWDSRRRMPDWCYVAASAASLSVTTTNWASGVIVPMVTRSARAAIQIIANALVIVIAFWIVQVLVIPSVPFFLSADPGRRFIFPDAAGTLFT